MTGFNQVFGKTGVLTSVLAVAVSMLAAPAWAQAEPDVPADAAGDDSDAIVVTARKRAETIVDVPLAVSALGDEALSARGIVDPKSLNAYIPGFRQSTQSGATSARSFNTFIIRGLNGNTLHPDRQNVGVFIDGVSTGGAGGIPGFANVERVEVVKGPQSAYFGRATFGGAVNYVTKTPSLVDWSAGVDVSLTSRGSVDQRAYVAGPVVPDILSVRLDGQRTLFESGYKNFGYGGDLGDTKEHSFAATVIFQPVEDLRVRGYYTGWDNDDSGNATQYLTANYQNCNAGAAPTNVFNYFCGGFSDLPLSTIAQNETASAAELASLKAADKVLGSDFPAEFGLKRKAHFGYVSADYDLPLDMTLSGYYGFHRSRFQILQDSGQRFETLGRTSRSLTSWDISNDVAEVRLASDPSKRFKFLVGFNYFHQDTAVNSFVSKNGVLTTALAPQGQKTDTYGVFGSASYDITDRLTASVEARRQIDKIRSTVFGANGLDMRGKTKSFTPRAILNYEVTPRLNTYASYAIGNRPAQFNTSLFSLDPASQAAVRAVADVPLIVPEEKIRMAELGLRGNFFENRLTLLSALYYGWWRDRQAQATIFYNRPSDGAPTSVILLVPEGKVDVYGIEAEVIFRATPELTLEGNIAFNETDIKYSVCTECRVINGVSNNVGNRLHGYAAVTGSAAATYRRELTDDLEGFVRAEYIHTGKQYATEANIAYVKPNNVVNLRAGIDTGDYKIELFTQNLFDSKVPLGAARTTDTYTLQNNLAFTPPQRRVVGVRLAADF
jgi:Outer membrane receptor proteins, mostly Fe transport